MPVGIAETGIFNKKFRLKLPSGRRISLFTCDTLPLKTRPDRVP